MERYKITLFGRDKRDGRGVAASATGEFKDRDHAEAYAWAVIMDHGFGLKPLVQRVPSPEAD